MINSIKAGTEKISSDDLDDLKSFFKIMVFDILGLKKEHKTGNGENVILAGAVELLFNLEKKPKQKKDWATADKIRNELNALGIELKDTKDGFEWKASSSR